MRIAIALLLGTLAGCSCTTASTTCTENRECSFGACIDGHCSGLPDVGPPIDTTILRPDAPLPDTGPPNGSGCSADLRDVLDATGGTLRTCPPDQGCSMGACVPACDAAAAAHGSIGCAFLAMTPPTYPPALPPCHSVFLANTWDQPVRVTVHRGGTSYDATTFGRIVDNATTPDHWAAIPVTGIPVDAVGVLFLTVDCVGEVSGWTAVDAAHAYEVANVDLVRAGVGVGSCVNGHHVASSAAPFGVVVWGTDAYASYAYPAGGNAQQLAMLGPII